jgi:enoyl-CoA hydratase/carnithine racemase
MNFKTIQVRVDDHIGHLVLNRPDKANAMSVEMWNELPQAAAWLGQQAGVRVVILSGEGKHFTAGIDVSALAQLGSDAARGCPSRGREKLLDFIQRAQASLSSLEQLRVPVIAAIHGACYGAGVDLIAACDMRLATRDAKLCIKEVDMAVVPDVGTIQRLLPIIGLGRLTELVYTAEVFDGTQAQSMGLVTRVFDTREDLQAGAERLARTIAAKSPLTVRGIKRSLLWSRDHDVRDGLDMVAVWNSSMLLSHDLTEALSASLQKREAKFAD